MSSKLISSTNVRCCVSFSTSCDHRPSDRCKHLTTTITKIKLSPQPESSCSTYWLVQNKKHLKNVVPIRHCEPPPSACFTLPFTRCRYCRTPPLSHAACASMSTTTSTTTTTHDRGDRYSPMEWAQLYCFLSATQWHKQIAWNHSQLHLTARWTHNLLITSLLQYHTQPSNNYRPG